MRYCTRCLNPSTRPRITFNSKTGECNACQWSLEKRTINWTAKWQELEKLCNRFRRKKGFDVIVPCSGGKDGSYVAWKLKNELDMHPLCFTLMPQIQTEVGHKNLENFKKHFDHITISPNPEVYRKIAIKGFRKQGRPKLPFVVGITTAGLQLAVNYDVPLIVYGEEGEREYGGSNREAERIRIDRDYLIDFYYSGHDPSGYGSWWVLPEQKDLDKVFATQFSRFEDWDPEAHAELAGKEFGLQTEKQVGTFTDYAQLDDKLQGLHAVLMHAKFGFGRATSDVNIEIRAGRMTRKEGLEIVESLDGLFPEKYLPNYLEYFKMSEKEFWAVIDNFANVKILEKKNGRWKLRPEFRELRKWPR